MNAFEYLVQNSTILEDYSQCLFWIGKRCGKALRMIFEKYTYLDINQKINTNYIYLTSFSNNISLVEFLTFHVDDEIVDDEILDFMFDRGAEITDEDLESRFRYHFKNVRDNDDYQLLMSRLEYFETKREFEFYHPCMSYLEDKFGE